VFGNAGFASGEKELDDPMETPVVSVPTGVATVPTETAAAKIESTSTSEGLSILQKVLFLAVVTGCIAVYLRMNRVSEEDVQAYQKSLA